MRTRCGKSLRTGPPHNRPSRRSNGASPATDPDRGGMWSGVGHSCDGSGRHLPGVQRSRDRSGLGGWSARLGDSHAGHLCRSGCRLAAGHGLLARRARHRICRVEKQLSWIAHLASYAVALAALFTLHGGQRRSWLVVRVGCSAGGHLALRPCCPGTRRRAIPASQRPSGDAPGTHPASQRRSRYRND